MKSLSFSILYQGYKITSNINTLNCNSERKEKKKRNVCFLNFCKFNFNPYQFVRYQFSCLKSPQFVSLVTKASIKINALNQATDRIRYIISDGLMKAKETRLS